MDSARCSRCRGHTKTVSPDLFRGPILFNWAFRRNWTPEQVRGDTLSKCHSNLTPNVRECALFILSTVPYVLRKSEVHRRN